MEQYCGNHDALHDVKSLKTKCKQLEDQLDDMKKLVEENDTDRDYQQILCFVLSKFEKHDKQHKRERSENAFNIDEEEEDDDFDGNNDNDPQYELFLSGLKAHGKSYAYKGENKNDKRVFIKYEGESDSEEVDDQAVQEVKQKVHQRKRSRSKVTGGKNIVAEKQFGKDNVGSEINLPGFLKGKNVVKGKSVAFEGENKGEGVFIKREGESDPEDIDQAVKDVNHKVYQRKRFRNKVTGGKNVVVKKEVKKDKVGRQRNLPGLVMGKDVVKGKSYAFKVDNKGERAFIKHGGESDSEDIHQGVKDVNRKVYQQKRFRNKVTGGKSVVVEKQVGKDKVGSKIINLPGSVKGKNVVREDKFKGKSSVVQGQNKANRKVTFGVDNENLHQKAVLGNVGFANSLSSEEKKKKKKKKDENNNPEKETDDDIVPEVEILDAAVYFNREVVSSSSAPPKKSDKRKRDSGIERLGSTKARDDFRERVISVLKKPYDKAEHDGHKKAIRDGSYLDYYPGLGKKLKKHRYKRGKCLNILRGFFFWLQNLTQEGALQPWKDGECLAVEPGST